jgi:hypothetical protein
MTTPSLDQEIHHKVPSGPGAFCLCGRAVNPNEEIVRDLKDQLDTLDIERSLLMSESESIQIRLARVNNDLAKVRQQLLAVRCLDSKI